jgi:hypothetical protein
MKVGDVYYDAGYDEEAGKIDIGEYVLRTIRGNWGYLVQKEDFTWGKRSGKTGDYGWLDPIPAWCRHKFLVRNGAPKRFARSKAQAMRIALAKERETVAQGYAEEWTERAIKAYETRIKSEMTRKKKAKASAATARAPKSEAHPNPL